MKEDERQPDEAGRASRYSLAGVRGATMEPPERLVQRAAEVFQADDNIVAGYVVGSLATDDADPWSDADLRAVVQDQSRPELVDHWCRTVDAISPTVDTHMFGGGEVGGVCITPEWLHFDLVLNPRSDPELPQEGGLRALVDKEDILPQEPVAVPHSGGAPFFPEEQVRSFLYMLGNMVSVIGRNEPISGTNGVVVVRDAMLVRLLLAERGLRSTRLDGGKGIFPFTKRLRPFLTEEQYSVLTGLPPLEATLDSVIDGYVALGRAFLPRARRLAAATGAVWPEAYERASVSYFERSLGVSIG